MARRIITAIDVIDAGACADGVWSFVAENLKSINPAMAVNALLKLVGSENRNYVLAASNGDGYGYGYGNGNGDGYGDGYGNGDGNV